MPYYTSVVRCGLALALGLLAGCATEPLPSPEPPPPTVPPLPDTRVYAYPAAGQSPAQMDRDKYECHVWAVRQTNFDPSEPQVAPHQRVQVVPVEPPGTGTLTGAATGAVVGALASGPRDAGGGAVIGAIAGALFGTAMDSARAQQAANVQQQLDARDSARTDSLEERALNYRRAVSACLQGRSYTVK
jgi:hypothetical protein